MAKRPVKSTAAADAVPVRVTGAKGKTRLRPLSEAPGGTQPPHPHGLRAEFDSLLDRLQTPATRKALKSAFAATPKTLA